MAVAGGIAGTFRLFVAGVVFSSTTIRRSRGRLASTAMRVPSTMQAWPRWAASQLPAGAGGVRPLCMAATWHRTEAGLEALLQLRGEVDLRHHHQHLCAGSDPTGAGRFAGTPFGLPLPVAPEQQQPAGRVKARASRQLCCQSGAGRPRCRMMHRAVARQPRLARFSRRCHWAGCGRSWGQGGQALRPGCAGISGRVKATRVRRGVERRAAGQHAGHRAPGPGSSLPGAGRGSSTPRRAHRDCPAARAPGAGSSACGLW